MMEVIGARQVVVALSGIASGTIPNGATVIIHSDGKVGVITQTGSADPSTGTPVGESAQSSYFSSVYDSANGKVVIAYRDQGNSGYGTVIVGTVSGTSINFGSAVVFESANTSWVGQHMTLLMKKWLLLMRMVEIQTMAQQS